jgi:hypothetical protein
LIGDDEKIILLFFRMERKRILALYEGGSGSGGDGKLSFKRSFIHLMAKGFLTDCLGRPFYQHI